MPRQSAREKFRSLMKLARPFTIDVAALINMMTGASIRMASAKATPCAARLKVGSESRAMIAAAA